MDQLIQDIRYGIRTLYKSPGFALVSVVALSLGIGANTAIFSVVNSVLLRPPSYKDPDRLVMVWEHNRPRSRDQNVISPANFLDWRDQNSVFEEMAAFHEYRYNLTDVDDPEELPAQRVSTNFFGLLGVNAAIGRTFLPEDGQEGRDPVIIISHGLWQRRFGSDPEVIGKSINLNGLKRTVIGVMPPTFQFSMKAGALFGGKEPELWAPLVFTQNDRIRRGRYLSAVARIKPGIDLQQAQTEMNGIAGQLEEQYPDFNTGWGVNLVPIQEEFVGNIKLALWVLLAAVGFVLLIACANVANLLLARAASRQKEIAIRSALGARRGRIIRQLLTESILLSALGGVVGLVMAMWGLEVLLSLSPRDLLPVQAIGLDVKVLGFTLGLSVLTGVIFGLAPAIEASRPNLNETLKEGGRESAFGGRSHRLRNIFVVAEIALSLVLLIGSGLMIRSFLSLQAVDPGFNADRVLTVRLALPGSKYREDHQVIAFYKQALDRIRGIPGVSAASAINFLPFSGSGAATSFEIEGRPQPPAGEEPIVDSRVIAPDYFHTMGIPLVAGRIFSEREATEASHVVVINETMARQCWPDEDPIGKRVTISMMDSPAPSEVIGVVADVKHEGLESTPRAMAYWPQPELTYSFMTLVIRTTTDPVAFAPAVRREILAIDKDQPIAEVRSMEQLLAGSIARSKFSTTLLSIFASVALVLAAVGIYGVMAYSVTQRSHEIGIRMALGAQQSDVVRMVVRQGVILTGMGVGVGLAAALVLTRFISSLLFGVSATDPFSFAAISLLLTGVALAASLIPARRASRVDPMRALRYE
jgi:putative ABC transport system permease protein